MPEIQFDCELGLHEEASQYPEHPCRGWFRTHTYESTDPIVVTKIVGEINTGISESSTFFPVDIELSLDHSEWTKVGETGACGNEGYKPFSVDVDNIKAKFLRFHCVRGYVDGSRGSIYYGEVKKIPPGTIINIPPAGEGGYKVAFPTGTKIIIPPGSKGFILGGIL